MREIQLVHMEIEDACNELAEAVRDQAKNLLERADAIERSGRELTIATDDMTTQELEKEKEHALKLWEEMSIARLKEAELQQKVHRLSAELEMIRRREQR